MISYLNGTVLRKANRFVVIDVHGVGYAVHAPEPLRESMRVGDDVQLHIHTSVSESDIVLYGFALPEECVFFEHLISVSGIGARSAIQMMSQPVEMIARAIATGDIPMLMKLPGIGRKTAERMIIELKEKVEPLGSITHVNVGSIDRDALDALVALGFNHTEAMTMLSRVPSDVSSTEDMIQYALKRK